MTNEIGDINYRKLVYFFKNNIIIHFKDINDIFYNGLILDLDREKHTMLIEERVRGNIPIILEQIKSDTICEFKENGKT